MSAPSPERLRQIRMVVTDVDGVLTEGQLFTSDNGENAHAFHVRDGLALVRAAHAGLVIGAISGRRCAQVARRLRELRVTHIHQGVEDKARVLQSLCDEVGIAPSNVAFMGDDVNDIPAFRLCGLPVAVADAAVQARTFAREKGGWVLDVNGGKGAARMLLEAILTAQGRWLLPGEEAA